MLPLFYEECDACGAYEERTFTDSWTGTELCNSCLYEIIGDLTNSPCSERDNLRKLLIDHDLMDYEKEDERIG
jgi:hypothetical protein